MHIKRLVPIAPVLFGLALGAGLAAHAAPLPQSRTQMDPRSYAFIQLVTKQGNTLGDLPHGCITLARDRVCLPRVAVNGSHVPDMSVLSGVVGVATGPAHLRLQATPAIHAGIALAVFNRLLLLEAKRAGIKVSWAAARALAQRELVLYQKHPPAPGQFIIPKGESARQYFLSRRVIIAYQMGMVIGQERDRIARKYRTMPATRAFHVWFQTTLPHYRVTVNGKPPTFSLVAALPTMA